jgi:hypothetical protein
MANKLLVISEVKNLSHTPEKQHFLAPRFWHQLPQNKNQNDQLIRAAWYNIDLESWDPQLVDEPPSTAEIIGIDTYCIAFKVPSPKPIVMFDYDHPEYLKRLEYCREVDINITIKEVPVDGRWNP